MRFLRGHPSPSFGITSLPLHTAVLTDNLSEPVCSRCLLGGASWREPDPLILKPDTDLLSSALPSPAPTVRAGARAPPGAQQRILGSARWKYQRCARPTLSFLFFVGRCLLKIMEFWCLLFPNPFYLSYCNCIRDKPCENDSPLISKAD